VTTRRRRKRVKETGRMTPKRARRNRLVAIIILFLDEQ
jgi:hypothetical protein